MTYNELKQMIDAIDNPVERLEFVMGLGTDLETVPCTAECYDIAGCASAVQICIDNGRFYARADSALVRGLLVILLAMIDGKKIEQIKEMDLAEMFAQLNLNLGMGRMNGVNSMIRFFQNFVIK